ncbi:MAG: hypothetical protein EAZ79_23105 [Oscillatoriales cyanobacterium]|nr:MAG: hypothetical protein EAZ79_23105 [Oscillatoriales cyanobacterium]
MSPSKIYAPNVHLFAYHLRKESEPQKDNLKELFEKGENILKEFGINQTIDIQDKPGYRVELSAQQTEDDASIFFEKWSDSPIAGIAYPVRIHDTFALALNVRRPEKNEQGIKTSDVDQFWNSREDKKKLKSLADGCLRAFIPDKLDTPPFYRSGELFGSPIFEYGIADELENYCHVLVWIFVTPETDRKLQEEYPNLVDIFCYRHKITQAYKLSRSVYKVLSNSYKEVKAEIAIVESLPDRKTLDASNLEDLKKALNRIPSLNLSYVELIRNLDNYRLPLKINLQNYERELKLADLDYFANGSDLLEKALNAIRGRVEIEQAERDRSLEKTIQILGAGLGAGGIVSSAITNDIDKPLVIKIPQKGDRLHPGVTSLLFSLLAVIIVGGLVGWKNGKWKINGKFKSHIPQMWVGFFISCENLESKRFWAEIMQY